MKFERAETEKYNEVNNEKTKPDTLNTESQLFKPFKILERKKTQKEKEKKTEDAPENKANDVQELEDLNKMHDKLQMSVSNFTFVSNKIHFYLLVILNFLSTLIMNILCVVSFLMEYQMQDVSYIFSAYESLFYEKNILPNSNVSSLLTIDAMNYEVNPQIIKSDFIQTRLLDYVFNPDKNNLDTTFFEIDKPQNSSLHYYLFSKNRFLGMAIEIIDFPSNPEDDKAAIHELFTNVFPSFDEAKNGKKNENIDDSSYITERGCEKIELSENEKNQFLFFDDSTNSKILFFPGNITKCEALNIAFLENEMIGIDNMQISANLYYINPISNIIFNYHIDFRRSFTFGKNNLLYLKLNEI